MRKPAYEYWLEARFDSDLEEVRQSKTELQIMFLITID